MAAALAADLTCPLSQEIMTDPVIAADGHTYERAMIAEWLRVNPSSPLTREPLTSTQLIPNHTLKKVIEEWNLQTSPRSVISSPHLLEGDAIGAEELERVKQLVYNAYSSSDEVMLVSGVARIQNQHLTRAFDRCKARLGGRVKRLFHGTLKQSADSIAAEGFRIPESNERDDPLQETGQLTFGKAIYFSERAELACDFGDATLVIADVVLGREWRAEQSLPYLDSELMREKRKDSVHFDRTQEYACYKTEQAVPVYVVSYKLVSRDAFGEQYDRATLEARYASMADAASLDWGLALRHVGPDGRSRERHAALRKLGDCCRDDQANMCRRLSNGLLEALRDQCLTLDAAEQDAPVTWLALRLCWNAAYRRESMQRHLVEAVGASTFIALLSHWNNDVVDRAAGVILNLSQLSSSARGALWSAGAPMALARLVSRNSERFLQADANGSAGLGEAPVPHCLGAIANLAFAADTRAKFLRSDELREFLVEVAEPLMDSWSEDVRDEATRVFTCLIAGGTAPADWIQNGGAEVFQKSVSLAD